MFLAQNAASEKRALLDRHHFQLAYVTNDLAKATQVFAQTYGAKEFFYIRDVMLPMGGQIDIALAWVGNVNIEVIEGRGNQDSFYQRSVPIGTFAMAFHHLGYLIESDREWDGLLQTISATNQKIVHSGSDPSGLDFIYTEAPPLGHYLEFIRPRQAWIDLFNSLPRN